MSSILSSKVCVTGGAGYIGSWLVKKLLEKGHIVHATLRNLGDVKKVSLLKNLPGAESRLVLFEADLNKPEDFEHAIKGCEFVFHVATPLMQTSHNSQLIQIREAAVCGVRSIAECCIRSGTVKRLIYTATVIAASSLKDDGTGFKDVLDESCWTSLNHQFPRYNMNLKAYTESKTLAEKEWLKFGTKEEDSINGGSLEVVSLVCGLVGGDTILSYVPESLMVLVSHLKDCALTYQALLFIESLSGKVPIMHIDDIIDAHIFSMEKPSMNGRYLCSGAFVTTTEMADYYQKNYPELSIQQECIEGPGKEVKWGSRKLQEIGFEYKYDMKMILDDSIECARRFGYLTK